MNPHMVKIYFRNLDDGFTHIYIPDAADVSETVISSPSAPVAVKRAMESPQRDQDSDRAEDEPTTLARLAPALSEVAARMNRESEVPAAAAVFLQAVKSFYRCRRVVLT